MKIQLKNPIRLLKQRKFSLPQILVIIVLVAGLAFTGGVVWRAQQKARLAREAADKSAQDEAERLAKLNAEAELAGDDKKEDKPKETAKPKPAPAPAPVDDSPSLSLSGSKTSKGVYLAWNVDGISVTQGFKLLLSKSGTPVYGGDNTDYAYIKDSASRSYTWGLTSGKTYNFRICVYNGSGCSAYSNTITVTAPYVAPAKPTGSLGLSLAGGANVTWTNSGSAIYGYKLVWSTTSGPTYPGSEKKFYEKTATSGSIDETSGTYYVRICMYYEGGCINYSNQVTVTLP
jgi:hypothetical protein